MAVADSSLVSDSDGIVVLSAEMARVRPDLVDAYHAFVRSSPQGSIYCHTWWLEAVAPHEWCVHLLIRDGIIDAAWPLTTIYSRDGEPFIAMPPLTQKLGILLPCFDGDGDCVDQAEADYRRIEILIDQLPAGHFFSQRFHEGFLNWMPFMWRDYSLRPRVTYILPDIQSVDNVWESMRGSTRRQLKKSQKSGIEIIDDMSIDRFLPLHRMTYTRQAMEVPVDDDLIRRLDMAVVENADRRIFAGVDGEGREHAGAWVCWHNGIAYYIMGGSDPQLRKSGAHRLALWESIQFVSAYASIYDFEGSMIPAIEEVYRGFGAQQYQYSEIVNRLPWEHLFDFSGFSMFNRVRRHLGFKLSAMARRVSG